MQFSIKTWILHRLLLLTSLKHQVYHSHIKIFKRYIYWRHVLAISLTWWNEINAFIGCEFVFQKRNLKCPFILLRHRERYTDRAPHTKYTTLHRTDLLFFLIQYKCLCVRVFPSNWIWNYNAFCIARKHLRSIKCQIYKSMLLLRLLLLLLLL